MPPKRSRHPFSGWNTASTRGWAYFIVPMFALSNAGVALGTSVTVALGSSVAYGIVAGLLVGKQAGILAAAWLVVHMGWADLPAGVTWRHIWGAGSVAGIGFTMSLFIGELAFADSPALVDVAKVAILGASVLAASIGWAIPA